MKLDLHTHCHEATRFASPTVEVVGRIVARVKERGLDGIAITEHGDKEYGYQVKEMVERFFNNEVLIIPGWEIMVGAQEVIELFLPNNSIFKFWVHPRMFASFSFDLDNLQGIEIENPLHNWHINKQRVREIALKHDLLLLSNSDAHYLDEIGCSYNEIELEELCSRAEKA